MHLSDAQKQALDARLQVYEQNSAQGQALAEVSAKALINEDAETRFKALAAKADVPKAMAILDRLDGQFK